MAPRKVRNEARDRAEQRGLSAARGPGNKGEGAVFNFEFHVAQHRALRIRIGDGDTVESDHVRRPPFSTRAPKTIGIGAAAIPPSAIQEACGHRGVVVGAVMASGSKFLARNELPAATIPLAAIARAAALHRSGRYRVRLTALPVR